MTLRLYYHPLASFCHKVQIALYEAETPFEAQVVDLMDPGEHARFLDLWPVGRIPVLHDDARGQTIPESSIIIEYLDRHYPGAEPMLPADPDTCLVARLWDRFFDLHVQDPMQRIVFDRLKPESERDPKIAAEASERLVTAYRMLEERMSATEWAAGEAFSIADCAAAPALFFGSIVAPIPEGHEALADYFERLVARPSMARVLEEARPFFGLFPLADRIPARFREPAEA